MTVMKNNDDVRVVWMVRGRPVEPEVEDSDKGRWSLGTASLAAQEPSTYSAGGAHANTS